MGFLKLIQSKGVVSPPHLYDMRFEVLSLRMVTRDSLDIETALFTYDYGLFRLSLFFNSLAEGDLSESSKSSSYKSDYSVTSLGV